jgi:hypothetical protein
VCDYFVRLTGSVNIMSVYVLVAVSALPELGFLPSKGKGKALKILFFYKLNIDYILK